MKKVAILFCCVFLANLSFAQEQGIINNSKSPYSKLKSINMSDCHWTSGFWANEFSLCHDVMIPNMWELMTDSATTHIFDNFQIAAGLKEGKFKGFIFHDGDFYKYVESMCYDYSITKDEKINRQMDEIIAVIAKAQLDNGYISTGKQIRGQDPFENPTNHELYNFGHLQTAACIHYRATGKRNFLDVAVKASDYLYDLFHEPSPELASLDWNPPHYMGLVEMYRTTGDEKYLELAVTFIDMLGTAPIEEVVNRGMDHSQRRTSFREETQAEGHAGHANYMYCGVADVIAETGDSTLLNALNKIWENVAYSKMYITGATGSNNKGVSRNNDKVSEAYGKKYELPNYTGYSETCANIGNAMWNWRMFLLNGEAQYADIAELAFYNSALSGISLDGKHFFYNNPLRRAELGQTEISEERSLRRAHLRVFCCPPNIIRTIAKMQNYAYSTTNQAIWVNLYGSNELDTKLADGSGIKLTQQSDYPWDGKVRITLNNVPREKEFSLMMRIPGWSRGAKLKVNGKDIGNNLQASSYFEIKRKWSNGDIIDLDLPMPVELLEAHPLVEAAVGQVAVKRGPLVYCLESADLPEGINMLDISIPRGTKFKAHFDENLLSGVTVLKAKVEVIKDSDEWTKQLYRNIPDQKSEKVSITLVPYYAWSNRGPGDMTVWMPLK